MLRVLAAAFLAAYASLVSVALGALSLTLIARLTGAYWFRAFRAYADVASAALLPLAALGVVLVLASPVLYTHPMIISVRTIIYWVVWLVIARAARGGPSARVAAIGLIAIALTMTFAAFDWMMSLTPDFVSTIYGVYWWAGGMVGALAFLALFVARDNLHPDISAVGKLLLTFILFWVYTGFAQYIVIWSGDLPREVGWYVTRSRGGWGAVAAVMVFCSFVAPMLLLFLRAVRGSARVLGAVGAALLVFHFVDTYWIVMPSVAVIWWAPYASIAMLALMIAGSARVARMSTASVERTT